MGAVENLLIGAVDLHCHSGPSPMPRRITHAEAARQADEAGFRAIVAKCHYHDTTTDILAMAPLLDGLRVQVFGGIALNSQNGGLNPFAVDRCLKMGGKVIWFPTISSHAHLCHAAHDEEVARHFQPRGMMQSEEISIFGAFQVTDTSRVEAFSDGVFAVTITILALEMGTPAHRDGGLLSALLDQWPVYLHVANLAVLFIAAALPFPTGVLAHALQERITSADVRTAVVLYALIAAALSASWVWVYYQLICRPGLLEATVDARYVPQGLVRSAVGIVIYLLGGVLGWAFNPGIALAIFLLLPLFYFATTEGIPRTRTR